MTPLIVNEVTFSYRRHIVLQDIFLSLSPGEITYILGPNGAGKSTLVNCISGVLFGYKGSITIPVGSKMGALLDKPFIYQSLTVKDNIRIFLRYNKVEYSDYHDLLNQYLETNELLSKRFKKLSQGQRQRVLLFVTMINDPDIILLDEPFNGLDPFYTEKLITLLQRLKENGRTILINDHIISHTMRLADQIAFLIRHRLVWTMRAGTLNNGLYYMVNGKSQMDTKKMKSFEDCIVVQPPLKEDHHRKILDLTDLYTLAMEHGRTAGL